MIDFGNGSGGFGSVGMASLVVAVIAVVYTQEIVETVNSQKVAFGESVDTFAKGNVEEELTDIALKHGYGHCDTAAAEMANYLEKRGEEYEILEIRCLPLDPIPNIWCKSREILVSYNGYHQGVLYQGRVYCTAHPYGVDEGFWKGDFITPSGRFRIERIG